MPTSYDTATAELAMTLSTLAYVDENRTATQQQMIGEINAALTRRDTHRGGLSGDRLSTPTAATCSMPRATAKPGSSRSASAAAISRSGSIGLKTSQCSGWFPITN